MKLSPNVAVFWTAEHVRNWRRTRIDPVTFIWNELRKGRLRQGWAPPGSSLMEGGRALSPSAWAKRYVAGAREAWDRDDHRDGLLRPDVVATRYNILSRMLHLEAGDVLVVPRMPSRGEFAIVTVTDGYAFDDRHYRDVHPDLGHVVRIDAGEIRRWEYDSCREAKRIVAKFSNYRSAVTFVANPGYGADILKLAK
jgi:hypothetical protein